MSEPNKTRFFTTLSRETDNILTLFQDKEFIVDIAYYFDKTDEFHKFFSQKDNDVKEIIFNNIAALMPLSTKLVEEVLIRTFSTESGGNVSRDANVLQNSFLRLFAANRSIMKLLKKLAKSLNNNTTKGLNDAIESAKTTEQHIQDHEGKVQELTEKKNHLKEQNSRKDTLELEISKLECEADEEKLAAKIQELEEKKKSCEKIVLDMREQQKVDKSIREFLEKLPEFLPEDQTIAAE